MDTAARGRGGVAVRHTNGNRKPKRTNVTFVKNDEESYNIENLPVEAWSEDGFHE